MNLKQKTIGKRGSVFWGADPFENNVAEKRPWVVVSSAEKTAGNWMFVMPMTTANHPDNVYAADREWILSDLKKDTYVNPWVLRKLSHSDVYSAAGRVSQSFTDRLTKDFLSYIDDAPSSLREYWQGAIVETTGGEAENASRYVVLNNDSRPFYSKYFTVKLTTSPESSHAQPIPSDCKVSASKSFPETYFAPTHPQPLHENKIRQELCKADSEVVLDIYAEYESVLSAQ